MSNSREAEISRDRVSGPVSYHEKQSNNFLSSFLNFLRFSSGISPETKCAATEFFKPVLLPLEWGFSIDYIYFLSRKRIYLILGYFNINMHLSMLSCVQNFSH